MDYSQKFAPDELSHGVIWYGFGGNKQLVLESVLQYGRDAGYDIFMTGEISGNWRNLTLYVVDTKSGTVTELEVATKENLTLNLETALETLSARAFGS